jgi:hypothetical protein
VQSHVASPAIYVNINFDSDSDSDATSAQQSDDDENNAVPVNDRFKIVRVQQKGDVRVVSNLKIALTGHMKEQREVVDTQSVRALKGLAEARSSAAARTRRIRADRNAESETDESLCVGFRRGSQRPRKMPRLASRAGQADAHGDGR